MIVSKKMQVLPFTESDREQLEKWRTEFTDATLELSHDYSSEQVETAVVRDGEGRIVLALTGTILSGLGPLIKNPDASKLDVMQALFLAEAALTYKAVQAGAVDSAIVVPNHMEGYIKTLQKVGYEVVATNCVVMGRILRHDVKPAQEIQSQVEETEDTDETPELANAAETS